MAYSLAAALVALSARAALAPRAAAFAYGVPIADETVPTPYLEVKANRDFVLAGFLVVVAAYATQPAVTGVLLVGTIAPLADAWTVRRHGKLSATAIHLGTAGFMLLAATLAAAGR